MQRAIACATMARGMSVLESGELCADSESALRIARDLAASVRMEGKTIRMEGSPLFAGEPGGTGGRGMKGFAPGGTLELDCGESGLCMRMFSPIAALLGADTRLIGRGSLSGRPMGLVESPLRALGAECSTTGGFAPIMIRGPLRGGKASIDAGESSQLLTGLLIALPLAAGDSELRVARAVSRGYLDLTIDTCSAFGVSIERNDDFSMFSIRGGQSYKPARFLVEGDWSGAAFLIVAAAVAAVGERLEIRGLQSASSQPDKAILEAVRAAGAAVSAEGDVLSVGRDRLEAFGFDATDCPDLFPPLAALAASCGGKSAIRGVQRLKGKESDRGASLVAMLGALGVEAGIDGETMIIEGGRIRGGTVDACGDHRIAMAAAISALGAEREVVIAGSECVAKSWPGFFPDLASICH